MLRTADKRLLVGLPITVVSGPGQIGRIARRFEPPVTPDIGWLDGAPYYFPRNGIEENFKLSGTTILGWANRGDLRYPALPTGGTVSIDTTSARFPVTSYPGVVENRLRLTAFTGIVRPYSLFAAAMVTDFTTSRSIIGSTTGNGLAWRVNTSGQFEVLSSGTAVRSTTTFTATAGVPFAAGVVLDAATDITQYLGGATPETDAFGTALSINANAMEIGADTSPAGAAPLLGWVGEILLYGSELSPTDAAAVISYLQSKWKI